MANIYDPRRDAERDAPPYRWRPDTGVFCVRGHVPRSDRPEGALDVQTSPLGESS
jgi:hypothetical protein